MNNSMIASVSNRFKGRKQMMQLPEKTPDSLKFDAFAIAHRLFDGRIR